MYIVKDAVGAKTCASPVQPMRSSRCGQSVGTSRKLPIWPQNALLNQPVHLRVGSFDFADDGQVGVNDAGGKPVGIRVHSFHLHKPETVEGEVRPHVRGPARRNEGEFLFGGAQVVAIEVVVLQQLAELQIDLRALGQIAVELDPAGHNLAEIDHVFAGGRMQQPGGLSPLADAHGRRETGGQRAGRRFRRLCVYEAFQRAGDKLQPRVVDFAVVNAAFDNGGGVAQPRAVRAENQLAAVGKFAADFSQQLHAIAEQLAHVFHPAETALIPAVAEHRVETVFARAQQGSDIVSLILDPIVVIVIKRREHLVGYAFAVYRQFVYAKAGYVCTRADGRFPERKGFGEEGVNLPVKRRFDPFRLPGLVLLGSFEPRGLADGGFALFARRFHAPVVARARGERHFRREAEGRKILARAGIHERRVKRGGEGNLHARRLRRVAGGTFERPGQQRGVHFEAQRVFQMVGAQRTNQHRHSPCSVAWIYKLICGALRRKKRCPYLSLSPRRPSSPPYKGAR